MHARLIVLVNKTGNETSQQIRESVFNRLSDEGFCGEGSRFYSPPADWFVIGGRWSGEFTKIHLGEKKCEQFVNEFEQQYGWWTGGKESVTEQDRKKQAEPLFKRHFPNYVGGMPYWRNQYEHYGYEDDAQIVDKELYDRLLSKLDWDEWNSTDLGEGNSLVDLDGGEKLGKEDIIGKKWAVVVDFHS